MKSNQFKTMKTIKTRKTTYFFFTAEFILKYNTTNCDKTWIKVKCYKIGKYLDTNLHIHTMKEKLTARKQQT